MTQLTILLDLDNTLLKSDMKHFLPPYFARLAARLETLLPYQNIIDLMLASVRVMQANNDPTITNQHAFMRDFAARVQHAEADLQPLLDAFYAEDYPKLQQFTEPRPAARPLVERLQAAGHRVAIATNPLFPATAIYQRLAWANVADFNYELVTTMENSHFSKPDIHYYEEILARLNSPANTTWMIGDDPRNDIEPAHSLGLKTWWVSDAAPNDMPPPMCHQYGTLTDLLQHLDVLTNTP